MSTPLEQPFQPPPPPPQPATEPPARRPTGMRPFAIVFFVLGLVVLIGAIARFIPGGVPTGAFLCVLGMTLFGLSFVPLPRAPETEEPLPPIQKLAGVFYEPTRVFRNLRVHPHWVAAYLLITVMSVAYSFAFVQRVTPERIVNFMADRMAEGAGPITMTPEMVDQMRTSQMEGLKNPIRRAGTAVTTFVAVFIFSAIAAALYLVGVLAFGGRINFWQSLATYFYASVPITVISKVLSLVILYLKDPDELHPLMGQDTLVQDNLGLLFSPTVHPVLFTLAGAIGVLSLYGLWLRARGLHHGGTRVSSTAAWGVAIIFWALGLFGRTIAAALFPGFMG